MESIGTEWRKPKQNKPKQKKVFAWPPARKYQSEWDWNPHILSMIFLNLKWMLFLFSFRSRHVISQCKCSFFINIVIPNVIDGHWRVLLPLRLQLFPFYCKFVHISNCNWKTSRDSLTVLAKLCLKKPDPNVVKWLLIKTTQIKKRIFNNRFVVVYLTRFGHKLSIK